MNTFTLRNIPTPIDKSLRQIAHKTHKSLNQTAIDLLATATGVCPDKNTTKKKRDVSSVFVPWSKEEREEFQKNMKLFDHIDEEMWQK